MRDPDVVVEYDGPTLRVRLPTLAGRENMHWNFTRPMPGITLETFDDGEVIGVSIDMSQLRDTLPVMLTVITPDEEDVEIIETG